MKPTIEPNTPRTLTTALLMGLAMLCVLKGRDLDYRDLSCGILGCEVLKYRDLDFRDLSCGNLGCKVLKYRDLTCREAFCISCTCTLLVRWCVYTEMS